MVEESVKTSWDFDFPQWNFEITPIKPKQAELLIDYIKGSALCYDMKFSDYGVIEFGENDKQLKHPYITVYDNASSSHKINCLIYDLAYTPRNYGLYDKLFIYYCDYPKFDYYGYVMLNEETGKVSQTFYVDAAYDNLIRSLKYSLSVLSRTDKYEYYRRKNDCIRRNDFSNIPHESELADIAANISKRFSMIQYAD